jgi:ribosomal protein S12 methylthiotransferase
MSLLQLPILSSSCPSSAPPADSSTAVKGTYALVSLGCPKNLVDSERMAGLLGLDGYQLVHEPAGADFVVINTCGFIADARHESHATIREMLNLKLAGKLQGVIVAGCLVERQKDQLLEQYPEIDHLVGVFARNEIARAADRLIGGLTEQRTLFRPAPNRPLSDMHRLRITPRHLAFLKISEGCNRPCAFCSIPMMRGRHVSKPADEVVAEAEQLSADGVRELVIVAQDTTYYGMDTARQPQLAALLDRLEQVRGIEWIRLMYLYPMFFTDELLERLATSRRIIPYLDMPLQHVNDDVLRRMKRATTRAKTEDLLNRLRQRIPGLVMRTTLMAGFPGETQAQFDELLEFVRQQRFERLGAFAFCPEPDTPAAELDGQIPDPVRTRRRDQLLAVQQGIAFAWAEAQRGRRLDVLIDAAVPEQPGAFVGRSYADAPEVDGVVYVTGEGLIPGQIVPCEMVANRGYDLVGVAVDQPR